MNSTATVSIELPRSRCCSAAIAYESFGGKTRQVCTRCRRGVIPRDVDAAMVALALRSFYRTE